MCGLVGDSLIRELKATAFRKGVSRKGDIFFGFSGLADRRVAVLSDGAGFGVRSTSTPKVVSEAVRALLGPSLSPKLRSVLKWDFQWSTPLGLHVDRSLAEVAILLPLQVGWAMDVLEEAKLTTRLRVGPQAADAPGFVDKVAAKLCRLEKLVLAGRADIGRRECDLWGPQRLVVEKWDRTKLTASRAVDNYERRSSVWEYAASLSGPWEDAVVKEGEGRFLAYEAYHAAVPCGRSSFERHLRVLKTIEAKSDMSGYAKQDWWWADAHNEEVDRVTPVTVVPSLLCLVVALPLSQLGLENVDVIDEFLKLCGKS